MMAPLPKSCISTADQGQVLQAVECPTLHLARCCQELDSHIALTLAEAQRFVQLVDVLDSPLWHCTCLQGH